MKAFVLAAIFVTSAYQAGASPVPGWPVGSTHPPYSSAAVDPKPSSYDPSAPQPVLEPSSTLPETPYVQPSVPATPKTSVIAVPPVPPFPSIPPIVIPPINIPGISIDFPGKPTSTAQVKTPTPVVPSPDPSVYPPGDSAGTPTPTHTHPGHESWAEASAPTSASGYTHYYPWARQLFGDDQAGDRPGDEFGDHQHGDDFF